MSSESFIFSLWIIFFPKKLKNSEITNLKFFGQDSKLCKTSFCLQDIFDFFITGTPILTFLNKKGVLELLEVARFTRAAVLGDHLVASRIDWFYETIEYSAQAMGVPPGTSPARYQDPWRTLFPCATALSIKFDCEWRVPRNFRLPYTFFTVLTRVAVSDMNVLTPWTLQPVPQLAYDWSSVRELAIHHVGSMLVVVDCLVSASAASGAPTHLKSLSITQRTLSSDDLHCLCSILPSHQAQLTAIGVDQ